ncbi:transketolase C-terminal domain-containing protein, partial [Chloroflexota bacterium]
VQSQSEIGAINMLQGAAAAGVRAMTSTSSPGWGLMQEGISNIVAARLPCVIVLVQRMGPGVSRIAPAQMDYLSATRGGGGGGYKNIVLAPASVQEIHDLTQLAFYLADKYRNPVIVLSDGIIGHVSESLEVKTLEFDPLPYKDWAIRGRDLQKNGKRRYIVSGTSGKEVFANYRDYLCHLRDKYRQMETEVRYEEYNTDDADIILIAYGYCARVSEEAVDMAREQGINAGLLRPITLWPFPHQVIKEKAYKGCRFLVVEDSLGLMVDDVKASVEEKTQVLLAGVECRHLPTDEGMILPGKVLEEIRRLL